MNVKIKGKVYSSVVSLHCALGRDMGIEEGTGKEIGGCRNANATMDVLDRITNERIRGWGNRNGGTLKESKGKEVEVVQAVIQR